RFVEWVLEAGPWTIPPRLDFVRRSWAALALPLAAVFLVVALYWKVPLVMAMDRAGRLAPRVMDLETERLDRALAEHAPSGVRLGGEP
ncbi:MAG: hypothetical protein HYU66_01920, partial [Armatimonadetes bacterium]|nr:hypothetical protein [Armatimonadota bacterium]